MHKDKLKQLQRQLGKMGQLAAENMICISTPPIDITDMVTQSRLLVQGKTALEALKILVNLYPGAQKSKIRSAAEQELTKFHLYSFFGLTVRSMDGRIVAKNPGSAVAVKGTPKYEDAVWNEMIRIYYSEISVFVLGRVIPVLETMIAEHSMQERDFVSICSQSSIVPMDRVSAFAKALFAGYELDFDSVIHRLVPQLENMVRYHLKAAGAVTTTLGEDGIEMEVNLSALLERDEAVQIFGEEVLFEMKALFCDSRGPNFRHGLAHGLLEDKDFESTWAVYAWCFGLRLVFNVFWNTCRKE
ncbi:hypothetical protein LCGC14_2362200 [marine sediment metagenome]|uniref:DUF4209 domain-containing protein n=1 Tax=marine sediment metagenome TaxID=412755 RepID=A0A0F9CTN1_9ZZZZ